MVNKLALMGDAAGLAAPAGDPALFTWNRRFSAAGTAMTGPGNVAAAECANSSSLTLVPAIGLILSITAELSTPPRRKMDALTTPPPQASSQATAPPLRCGLGVHPTKFAPSYHVTCPRDHVLRVPGNHIQPVPGTNSQLP